MSAAAVGKASGRVWALANARIATMEPGAARVERGSIVLDGEIIRTVGADLPAGCDEVVDLEGRLVTPGLIDCHTHLVHGGNRAREFEMRLAGASYAEIARAGGGIRSTVAATRAADEASLLASAERRLAQMLREGLTTIEIKSGYGLDEPTEARMLRVARALGNRQAVTVRTSYLAAHALPPEFDGDADGYVARICGDWLPSLAAEGLVDAVDGFCETIAFDTAQISCVFETALGLGLPVKLHADQLTNGGGAALAASFGALSADHLEYTDEAGVAAMAEAGTVAVLLPGAYYFLRESQAPPVAAFRQHNVPIAVATDCNPGSSPLTSPLLTLNMAATMFRLTVEECLCGMTRNAARALGLTDRGTIAPGRRADLAIWDVETPAELVYRIGFNPCHGVIAGGAWRKETA